MDKIDHLLIYDLTLLISIDLFNLIFLSLLVDHF